MVSIKTTHALQRLFLHASCPSASVLPKAISLFVMCTFVGIAHAQAPLALEDLINNDGSIDVGDKTFGNFSFLPNGIDPATVDVLPNLDDANSPGLDFVFNTPVQNTSFDLFFMITSNAGNTINGASLELTSFSGDVSGFANLEDSASMPLVFLSVDENSSFEEIGINPIQQSLSSQTQLFADGNSLISGVSQRFFQASPN